MKVYTSENIKALEQIAVSKGISMKTLMTNAGNQVYEQIKRTFPPNGENLKNQKVVVLCGKGNNGGDGYVCANRLFESNALVRVILTQGPPSTELALNAFEELYSPIPVYEWNDENKADILSYIDEADIIVDGIFGFGFRGSVRGSLCDIIEKVNSSNALVYSIDMPSGLTCDNTEPTGLAIKANFTTTFTAIKPALTAPSSSSYAGLCHVASVGIDKADIEAYETNLYTLTDKEAISFMSNKLNRPISANKGTFGKLVLICGSMGMIGACMMAAKGALRSGVGLVNIVLTKEMYPLIAPQIPEPIYTILDFDNLDAKKRSFEKLTSALSSATAVVMGCGLGETAEKYVPIVLENANCPVVLDADALNYISQHKPLLENRNYPIIITPHPGEMSRLSGLSVKEVQADRIKIATTFTKDNGVYTVLKGSGTIISTPDGKTYINTTGNPGMSKGGSGDVLAGILGSLLAQGLTPEDAAVLGVYVHGKAGDLAAEKFGQISMQPTDLIEFIKDVFTNLK